MTGTALRPLREEPRRGWPNAVHGEVLKLVTLPALWITVGLTWAVTLLVRVVGPAGSAMAFGQMGVLVLGALAATHEHQGGGQFRTTLLAVPRRPVLAVARAVALAVTAAPVALVVAGTAGEPGGAGFLVLDALLAAGVGTIVRYPVGTVAVLLTAYWMVLPMVRGRFADLAPWLPEHDAAAPAWTAVILLAAAVVLVRREA
ncbi:hypothetical protein [Actinoplanes utahensis]|uniref:hypothetical protein n=1 Tax=Actinoplanes utahensis TaxID=1869 RepID=UPI00068D29E8|nr:hypothetical protein [Actinoplanes utahensis]GIF29904.1 hypothetical protein Aut01nite_28900 [Actinoplanes utahensis]